MYSLRIHPAPFHSVQARLSVDKQQIAALQQQVAALQEQLLTLRADLDSHKSAYSAQVVKGGFVSRAAPASARAAAAPADKTKHPVYGLCDAAATETAWRAPGARMRKEVTPFRGRGGAACWCCGMHARAPCPAGKFFKMLAMGVPKPGVMQKMTMVGLDPKALDDPSIWFASPAPAAGGEMSKADKAKHPIYGPQFADGRG